MARNQQTPIRLVIVVTGANGGVGFGICHRLLVQLCQPQPADARPSFASLLPNIRTCDLDYSAGVTIVMACRNLQRAGRARDKLYSLLDAHIATIPRHTPAYGYASAYREKVQLDIHHLDLGVIRSVLHCGKGIAQKYPYVSHLICNAGLATYSHLDIGVFLRQCLDSPLSAIRNPTFNIQKVGIMSEDHLGFVWQCNVFGHYVLFRTLQPLLNNYSNHFTSIEAWVPARVLWMSSIDALPTYDSANDWQLTKTDKSYQASKAQIDFIAIELARPEQANSGKKSRGQIEHLLISPGVTATKVAAELLRPRILEWLMLAFFYFCRLLGSPHVLFSTYQAAIAASHLSLVPDPYIPTFADGSLEEGPEGPSASPERGSHVYPKFSAMSNRWGIERVGIERVMQWKDHPDEGSKLLARCEQLYQAFVEAEGQTEGNGEAALQS